MNKNRDIVGQKLSVFTPTKDGYYYVKVTNDSNCSNDSDSVLFKKQVGLWRMLKTRISIYPNPSNEFEGQSSAIRVTILE